MQRIMSNATAQGKVKTAIQRRRSQIARLRSEIDQLEDRLRELRRLGAEEREAPRASSIDRVIIEEAVLDRLRQSSPPRNSSDQLWLIAAANGVRSRSTFRSQLRRMALKGLIVSAGRGIWELAPCVSRERVTSPELQRAVDQLQGIPLTVAKRQE